MSDTEKKLFPIKEAITLMDEGIIENFTWLFEESDRDQVTKFRNALSTAIGRSSIKATTQVINTLRNDQEGKLIVTRMVTMELSKNEQ